MHTRRLAALAALSISAGTLTALPVAAADSGTTLYVNNATAAECSDATSDSSVTPYCTVQAAANVVTAGQTILVAPGIYAPFTISASGTVSEPITVEAANPYSDTGNTSSTISSSTNVTAITISGAEYVDLSGFQTDGYAGKVTAGPQISVTGSSNITLDGIGASRYDNSVSTGPAIAIDGASSDVTVSRSTLTTYWGTGVQIGSGSSDDVITTNYIMTTAAPGIAVEGASGTDVTSNTIGGSCGEAILLTGASGGSSIENNVTEGLVDSSTTPCATPAASTSAIEVDSSAIGGTTLDYNIAYAASAADSAYDWAGTYYHTASALYAATGQGKHDLSTNPMVETEGIVWPSTGSPAIDSANSSAPGELPTDLYNDPRADDPVVTNTGAGSATDYDRGAAELQGPAQLTSLTESATQAPVGGIITFKGSGVDPWGNEPLYCSFSFGDGTSATGGSSGVTHAYLAVGDYTTEVGIRYAENGLIGAVTAENPIEVVSSDAPLTAAVSASPLGALGVGVDASKSTSAWSIASYVFNYGDGSTTTPSTPYVDHEYKKPGVYTVKVTETDGGGRTATATTTYATPGTDYAAYGPIRILDTRNGTGTGGVIAKIPAGGHATLQIEGNGGIPATGVAAVVLNVTATDPGGSGFITAYADGTTPPNVSNLNYTPGKTVPNSVIAPVGADGRVDLYNGGAKAGSVDLIADVTGYFTESAASGFTPLTTDRLLDTRNGTGTGGVVAKVKPGQPLPLTIAGADSGKLPATGITAVALNVTVTNPIGSGFITAYPAGESTPNSSNLNYSAGQTVANTVIVPVGAGGKIELFNGGAEAGSVDLIADVTGYYSATSPSVYVPIAPVRLFDTRTGDYPLYAGSTQPFVPWGLSNSEIPSTATAFVFNLTVTETSGSGYIVVYPYGGNPPNVSNLNYTPGVTVANMAQSISNDNGGMDSYNGGSDAGTVQLIVDAFGYYTTS